MLSVPCRAASAALAIGALIAGASSTAFAADKLRVGKSPAYLFSYVPVDVGLAQGFFQSRGLDIDVVAFEGAAKMDMAMTADSIDISLGSPMEMAGIEKGMPAVAIATIAHPIRELSVIVPADSPIKSVDELKGKSMGIATMASITQWAALELARVKGWGNDGLKLVAIGSGTGSAVAAIRAHLVDSQIANLMTGVVLERQGQARQLAIVADYASDFIMHEMAASRNAIAQKPDAIRHFAAGWFEAVAYMRTHKAETIKIAMTTTGLSEGDEALEYDTLMPAQSGDGRHDPKIMARTGQSFVELGILDHAPDMSKLYTEAFLPPR